MELQEIKRIQIVDYLLSKGISPVHTTGKKATYRASWDRRDTEPSVSVNLLNNTFYDFGKGKGGSIIDLVCYVENCSVSDAIKSLKFSHFVPGTIFEYKPEPQYEVEAVLDELPPSLRTYIENRCISHEVYSKYVKQVRFRSKRFDRTLFGIGFSNDAGGWEIRTRTHKTSIAPKAITTLEGTKNVSVFEGFIDFLSACEYYKKFPTNTVVVLNSTANVAKVDWSKYERAFLFLDNDKSGNEATKFIGKQIDSVDMRFYETDFNDFLTKICF